MKQMIAVMASMMLSITPSQGRADEAKAQLSVKQDGGREVVLIGDE